jgi:hypothetical protein
MDTERLSKKDGILSKQLANEWVLYDPERGSLHFLNTTAEFIWRMCDGTSDISKIEQLLREAYAVPADAELRKAVEDIIGTFADMGILTRERVGT